MKRVLIFSLNYYPDFVGGAEVAIKEITDRFSPSEFEFHVLTLRFNSNLPQTEVIGNVTVHRIGYARPSASIQDLAKFPLKFNKYWYQFAAWLHAEQLHKKYSFDMTWAMMAHSCAIPGGLFKRFHPRVPYLLTLQEGDPIHYIERQMKPVWPLFIQGVHGADALQAISTFLLTWGKNMGFSGNAIVIPNGVNTERFSQQFSTDAVTAYANGLGKKDGDVYLTTTSRLVHKNGLDVVIESLPLVPTNVSFVVYGIGPDEEKLRARATELGVESRVQFLGQLSHEEMPLALRACDIFIRPSRSEGMGNSFIEAMAAQLPVVATLEGGIPDFLFDEHNHPDVPQTGWSVSTNSPKEIAEAVTYIMEHPSEVQKVVSNAHALVLEKYDWNLVAERMRDLFVKLLETPTVKDGQGSENTVQ